MKQIKFRGLTVTKGWAYGLPQHDLPNSTAYYADYSSRICWHPETGGSANVPILNGTLGQFTGSVDKNGKDVYEGDILAVPHFWGVNGWCYLYHVVEWSEKFSGWLCRNTKSQGENVGNIQFWVYAKKGFEVVGNIYENPELLTR